MDMQKLTIGQMAEINDVKRQTLLHYETKGLLIPYYTEPDTGYRYYHINQSAKLDMIQYLKFCGMSLNQIKKQFEIANIDEIQGFLTTQLGFIDESIRRLNQSRRAILQTVENYNRYKAFPFQTILHEYMQPRKIYIYQSKTNFFEPDGYEMMLRELKLNLINKNLSTSYLCNIGTIIRKSYLEKHELYSNEVFMSVEDDWDMPDMIETIPGGMYVSICSDNLSIEPESANRLLNYIRDTGYIINGDYICEVMADLPMFEKSQRSMVYRIQIPVRSKE